MSSLSRRKRARVEATKSNIAFVEQHGLIHQNEAILEEQALLYRMKWTKEPHSKRRKWSRVSTKFQLEQEATRRKVQMQKKTARESRRKAELKVKFNLREAQGEATVTQYVARILEYDESQSFGDVPYDTVDPLQRMQDFVNKHNVPTAVWEVTTGPLKKKPKLLLCFAISAIRSLEPAIKDTSCISYWYKVTRSYFFSPDLVAVTGKQETKAFQRRSS